MSLGCMDYSELPPPLQKLNPGTYFWIAQSLKMRRWISPLTRFPFHLCIWWVAGIWVRIPVIKGWQGFSGLQRDATGALTQSPFCNPLTTTPRAVLKEWLSSFTHHALEVRTSCGQVKERMCEGNWSSNSGEWILKLYEVKPTWKSRRPLANQLLIRPPQQFLSLPILLGHLLEKETDNQSSFWGTVEMP